MSQAFTPEGLLAAYPLAWVVSAAPQMHASLIPVQIVQDATTGAQVIRGHFARRNPQVEALRQAPRATILALGPHGYISPSWLSDRTQAPSWNYAAARFDVEIEFVDRPEFTRALLEAQVEANERGRANAWSIPEMGARFDRLAAGVIGFQARVLGVTAHDKLGQADRDDVLAECLTALAGDPLADWMAAANPGRVPA
ncbi:MAG: FMN-binding negative transcriptional regulator [Proteobacteria bacterium]|nr:FMN-binding negative transcriptional regulator [Pseudomonadota bacterium]